jgi:hypothetical protein
MTHREALAKEAKELVLKLLPPKQYEENFDCIRLWDILDELEELSSEFELDKSTPSKNNECKDLEQ